MATPHVVGVVSLLSSQSPSLTPSQSLLTIQTTASPFPGGSTCNTSICGNGIINAGAAVNELPRVTSLNPNSTGARARSFTLTVTGANFANRETVQWNGSNRSTSYTNSTQLQATILASDT